jgi:cbb3-type cytochrome c oxidase subunit III
MRVVIGTMKIFRHASLLAAAMGLFLCQSQQRPIYAASGTALSVSQTEQAPASQTTDKLGAEAYTSHCAVCHGEHREGILPAFPPLLGIGHQMTETQITDLIHTGKGRMPGFPKIQNEELAALLRYLTATDLSSTTSAAPAHPSSAGVHSSELAQAGSALFQQNCAFCHGRDAMGGETGPDLTQSKLVLSDVNGDKISEVVRDGRPEKKMPSFNFSNQEVLALAAFIHERVTVAVSQKGKRRGVDVSDLQTGNVEMGRQYFNGAGGCAKCHSPTGDLAGVASRYQGLQLEERMLYPRDAKSQVTVTLPSGKKLSGTLAYLDEFTVGLRDSDGTYHSWAVRNVKYVVDAPVTAHVDLFSKYTDADIHNLMAYVQTLR